jgi:antitoxin VapB
MFRRGQGELHGATLLVYSARSVYILMVYPRAEVTEVAKLFRSNRSQAVRIPKEFEFPPEVTDVEFVRSAGALILVPKVKSWKEFYERFPPSEFEFPEIEDLPQQERNFDWP